MHDGKVAVRALVGDEVSDVLVDEAGGGDLSADWLEPHPLDGPLHVGQHRDEVFDAGRSRRVIVGDDGVGCIHRSDLVDVT